MSFRQLAGIIIFVFAGLACVFGRPGSSLNAEPVIVRTRLPTLTPTATPFAVSTVDNPAASEAALAPASSPTQEPNVSPPAVAPSLPVSSPAEQPGLPTPALVLSNNPSLALSTVPATIQSSSLGWEFSGTQIFSDLEMEGLLIYGDLVNQTGAAQQLARVGAAFYNGQGQLEPNVSSFDYWPLDTVPPGGRVPFELTVVGLQNVTSVDLKVEARLAEYAPRQDFELSVLNASVEAGEYCVAGRSHNPGGALSSYLTIVAVLFDSQGRVINFGNDRRTAAQELAGQVTIDFEICADSYGQNVTRYEVRAWGL